MLKLAINYSEESYILRQEGELNVDLLKCALQKDWIEDAQNSGPIYVHFPFGTTLNGFENFDFDCTDWDWVNELLETTQTPAINLHIKFDPRSTESELSEEDFLNASIDCIEFLRGKCPGYPVIIENIVVRKGAHEAVLQTSLGPFFTKLISLSKCKLLLDSAHLKITCIENGLDFREELLKFPLHELYEWHICGVSAKKGSTVLFDSMPMSEDDWQLTAFVVAAIGRGIASKPEIVAIEYGGIGEKFDWRSDSMEIFTECKTVRHMLDLIE